MTEKIIVFILIPLLQTAAVKENYMETHLFRPDKLSVPEFRFIVQKNVIEQSLRKIEVMCIAVLPVSQAFITFTGARDGQAITIETKQLDNYGGLPFFNRTIIRSKGTVKDIPQEIQAISVSCEIKWRIIDSIELISEKFTTSIPIASAQNVKHSTHGELCDKNKECVGEMLKCDFEIARPTCTCDLSSSFVYNREVDDCILFRLHNSKCFLPNHCQSSMSCSSESKRCACSEDYTYMNTTRQCRKIVGFGEVCTEERQCDESTECKDSTCKCTKDFYEDGRKCSKRKLTDAQARSVAAAVISACSTIFILVILFIGRYFYLHSYKPSQMFRDEVEGWGPFKNVNAPY